MKNNSSKSSFKEFLPSMTLAMERPPSFYARMVSFFVMTFVFITILWLILAKVDIVVSAQGKVVPSGKVKLIQAAEEGVVVKIYVTDGQTVKKGDLLVDLDSTSSGADEKQVESKLTKSVLTVQRLRLELGEQILLGEGVENKNLITTEHALMEANKKQLEEKLNLLESERAQAKASLKAAQLEVSKLSNEIVFNEEQLIQKTRQAKEGLIAGLEVQDAKFILNNSFKERQVQKQRVNESKEKFESTSEKLESAKTEYRGELLQKLTEAEHEYQSAVQDKVKSTMRMEHQALKAPVNGVVQQLSVNTVGAVVNRADQLMVIIPEGTKLEIEAQILNKDIGFVDSGQLANVKVDAFEYTRYGSIQGDIEWVGSDAVLDEQKGPIYPARIKLSDITLPRKVSDRIAQIVPGMSVTADIVIGERRLIEYFSGPFLRYKDESLNER